MTKEVYCVGLIGNIASGKSTVAGYFAALGVAIINADAIAKDLTKRDKPAFHEMVTHFGQSILTATGDINRRFLRQLIFRDPNERLWLEALLHPQIRSQILHEISQIKGPYCLVEIPLLKDKANHPYLNRILLVQATPELQVARFMSRDKGSKEEALAILATQTDESKHRDVADDILINTGSLAELLGKVTLLNDAYLRYSQAL